MSGNGPKTRQRTTECRDLPYGCGTSAACKLDVYLPVDTGQAVFPGLLFIHGGGWAGGDRTDHREELLSLAQRGYVVTSVGYRLTGEAQWPAQLLDCARALNWLRGHVKEYRQDPARIGLMGVSAGAHLAAMLALCPVDTFGPAQFSGRSREPVQAVVMAAGPADLSAAAYLDHFTDIEMVTTQLLGVSPRKDVEYARRCSPVAYVHKAAPPFFVLHGGEDSVVHVSQATDFAGALAKAGAEVEMWIAAGCDHGFEPDRTPEAWRRCFDFLDRTL